jgi:hypothetical protein
MGTTDFDLRRLLAPIPTEDFFRDTWERQPLTIQRQAQQSYAGLFALADVDAVIAFSRPRFAEGGVFAGSPPLVPSCVQGWLSEQLGPTDACRDISSRKKKEDRNEKLAELRKASHDQLMKLLTNAQRTQWEQMAGAPFKGILAYEEPEKTK